MLDVLIALVPAIIASIVFSGYRSAIIIFVCVASAVLAEAFWQILSKKDVTISDFSAAITGLLLALLLPARLPLWMAVIGSVFAILVAKQFFGGLGNNFINPALAGYAFLLLSWGETVTIGMLAQPYQIAIISIAILAGGVYLLIRKVINWRTPAIFIAMVLVSAFVIMFVDFHWVAQPQETVRQLLSQTVTFEMLSQLLVGNLIICAFFMATDPVTTPLTNKGQVYFALGCGILTVIFNTWGVMPSGAIFAVLIMNTATPLLDKISMPKRYVCKEAKSK